MIRVGVAFLVLLGAAVAGAATAATPFRLAVQGPSTQPCSAPTSGLPAGERAYEDHLAGRLGRKVERCPFATPEEAARALAAGQVDMARLTPAAYAPIAGQVRAILTVRGRQEANRIAVVVAVRNGGAPDVAALKSRNITFGGTSAAGLATPRRVLAELGLAPDSYTSDVAADGDLALADLRAGKADAAAVHAAAWQRVCLIVSPKAPPPCRDLTVLARARPRADVALAVRRDMPDALRYQIVGIHLALHLENPAAFAFAAGRPDGAEFQPAEAEALSLRPPAPPASASRPAR